MTPTGCRVGQVRGPVSLVGERFVSPSSATTDSNGIATFTVTDKIRES